MEHLNPVQFVRDNAQHYLFLNFSNGPKNYLIMHVKVIRDLGMSGNTAEERGMTLIDESVNLHYGAIFEIFSNFLMSAPLGFFDWLRESKIMSEIQPILDTVKKLIS